MDLSTVNILTKMAADLTSLAVKGTVTKIHSKIESVKSEKNADILRNTYDELVNQLLSEREEAIRIAQTYKDELDKIIISDADIEHLHNTVAMVLETIKHFSPEKQTINELEPLKKFISIDVLKTMQLLGFNYKAAIGEPLTALCAEALLKLGKTGDTTKKRRS